MTRFPRTQHASLREDAEKRFGPAPDFTPLTSDAALRMHLTTLWNETALTLAAGANVATVVMCGSLLEAALLAKCLDNDAVARATQSAPRYRGKPRGYERWNLGNFIDVATEVGWIRKTRPEFVILLRQQRNRIHPFNALRASYEINELAVAASAVVVHAAIRELGVVI